MFTESFGTTTDRHLSSRHLAGVAVGHRLADGRDGPHQGQGVLNHITVKPRASREEIKRKVEMAFERNAQLDARRSRFRLPRVK